MIPHARIRAALRKLWLFSPERRAALKRAKWNGTKFYRCELCHKPAEKVDVDHVVTVGGTPGARGAEGVSWDSLIEKLFVAPERLQVICKPCHQTKTQKQRKGGAA